MATTQVDRSGGTPQNIAVSRTTGLASSAAFKAPCRAVATTNISLSGEQTIDGVAVVDGDRVLVNGQSDATQNGIYIVSTGDWERAPDFKDNNDAVHGTSVRVVSGDNAAFYVLTTVDPIIIGTSNLTFATDSSLDFAPIASPAFTGTPTAPTASPGTNTAQLATTAFVKAAIDVVLGGVSAAYDTLSEIATALTSLLTTQTALIGVQHIPIDAGSMIPGNAASPTANIAFQATNGFPDLTLDFADGAVSAAYFKIPMPKRYDNGTFTYQVIWTAASGSGDAEFGLSAVAAGDNENPDIAWGTEVTVTDTLGTASRNHRTAMSGAVTPAGTPATGDMLYFRLRRHISGSDTLNAAAKVKGIVLVYTPAAVNDA